MRRAASRRWRRRAELLVELGVEPRIARDGERLCRPGEGAVSSERDGRPAERPRPRARRAARTTCTSTSTPTCLPRRIDDVTLAGRFAEVGLAGFALKSHYTSTAERAQVVSAVVPGVHVIGTLTLNQAVGGMNALAVEIAAREGARIVWMPTVDSPAETAGRTEPKPGDKVPLWAKLQHELRELGLSVEPVRRHRRRTGSSCPRPATCCATIARHGLILATAHLGRDDTFAVVDGGVRGGRRRPSSSRTRSSPCQNFSIEDQVALADRGCLIERCLTTPLQRQDDLGARLRRRPRGRRRARRSSRATAATRTTRRSRTGSRSGPTGCSRRGFGEDEMREMIVDRLAAARRDEPAS